MGCQDRPNWHQIFKQLVCLSGHNWSRKVATCLKLTDGCKVFIQILMPWSFLKIILIGSIESTEIIDISYKHTTMYSCVMLCCFTEISVSAISQLTVWSFHKYKVVGHVLLYWNIICGNFFLSSLVCVFIFCSQYVCYGRKNSISYKNLIGQNCKIDISLCFEVVVLNLVSQLNISPLTTSTTTTTKKRTTTFLIVTHTESRQLTVWFEKYFL